MPLRDQATLGSSGLPQRNAPIGILSTLPHSPILIELAAMMIVCGVSELVRQPACTAHHPEHFRSSGV